MSPRPRLRTIRNLLIAAVVVAGLVAGYLWLRKQKYEFSITMPEFTTIVRGDLNITITASGVVRPVNRVEVKSKASGEIIRIGLDPDDPNQQGTFRNDPTGAPIQLDVRSKARGTTISVGLDPDDPNHRGTFLYEGDIVHPGQLLIQLDPADERRSVRLRQADAKLAKAALDKARIEAEQGALARIETAQISYDLAEWEYERKMRPELSDAITPEEKRRVKSRVDDAKAKLDSAKAQLEQARQDVARAEATYDQAQTALEEAQERFDETTIRNTLDGQIQITRINTRVGEVIQSGVTTITGGTILMVLADIGQLLVTADVDESDIGRVRRLIDPDGDWGTATAPADLPTASGQATISVDAFPNETFTGAIARIRPEPDKTANVTTYAVEILVTSPNRDKLMLGMDATVEFTAQSLHDVLLVEIDAVKSSDTGQIGVYVPVAGADGQEKPEFQPVERGINDGIRVQILAGAQEGQRVYSRLPVSLEGEEQK
ncbi:MAG TPA: HlyD family efflux transporter periplasmic adaptor subunit [Phycisphaerae bacterium]|nr:HlyD family efflux transporter periplasmic adaptor subunit [Phycisphaerae bacterium]